MFDSHFQTYEEAADPSLGAPRLKMLRARLKAMKLDGFLIPRADAHQNEYVAPCEERLAWLTGFTGSAGFAIVLADKAAMFVDGRYTIQAREQVDAKAFALVPLGETPPSEWLAKNAKKGARIGYDPWLHTNGQIARFETAAKKAEARLVAVEENPLDLLWEDRPTPPRGRVVLHPQKHAGEAAAKKLKRVAEMLSADALLVSDPHALAWAFNLRGGDVAHTPIALGYALIPRRGKPRLFLDPEKLNSRTANALGKLAHLSPPDFLPDALKELGAKKQKVLFDAGTAPERLARLFTEAGGQAEIGNDPIALMKARKNAAELAGARAAHLRDGVAMARFLCWFDKTAPRGRLTEIAAAQALETFRRESGELRDISFPTISAAGSHAALPHYRVTEKSNARIGKGVYLVDSGAQYPDGTTDVTRTLAVGRASKAASRANTLVLKGHIAIARAIFPEGTSGAQIDAFARRPLWEAGLDFDHGTGHGVGSYLSVHEGPQRISKLGGAALEPGMILSNEPGYYREGAFGIRIENLVAVEKRNIAGAEREMLGFETLTLVPIDLRLVEPKLLTNEEKAWLNAYHARVRAALSPFLDPAERAWLKKATKRIS
ncbi:aminopeptidase P family protein [Rhodoblastus acidophilus]|uniref:Aminopeptidase P family protein n=1 Tax=Candidatus Rhodoblastus alkanivorans TaxID=2954117 RepID=A0ABS9Z765_9HYPH|nr:aminopeptidase P family protein [Candidatus Rhodoblastus alkanivorans]MCI4678617.1 aminopeptidase P family protein [Candidatus Rhodoblastus alkanivorans]MCI4683027.1 aminopeptidase P family protein [Candidatus Rhodoblastus alkanivorans]MDI4640337.1 aminopeptidase P family protein [Rhodoblastus acidophilus]